MNFLIGCAVWAYKGWLGDFYPSGSRAADFLRLYSQRFTAVEGNTTFYAIPDRNTVKRWAAETPADFKFCLKLPRSLTHNGLLQPSLTGALKFLEQMQELGDKLGVVFAQLPPHYDPKLFPDLIAFLEGWHDQAVPLALEVRHPGWFQEPHATELNTVLTQLGVGKVLLDTRPVYTASDDPQINSERRKPQLPLQPVITAPFSLIRFISHPEADINQVFLAEWVNRVNQWLQQGTRIYFFVHCPVEERSPQTARNFQQLLEQRGAPVPPLPWNCIKEPPQQLSLF
ncbi:MAG TPA: DUF72 domain-containing protein [Oculatellaceae cyanobacterium]|jgi:uncharacterized protein YecE (DUF72 family)